MKNQDKRPKGASVRISSKSPIAHPPRAALHGRSAAKADPTLSSSNENSPESKTQNQGQSQGQSQGQNSSKDKDGGDIATAAAIAVSKSNEHGGTEGSASPSSREKDDKIKRLERELRIMEDEFSKELNTFSYKLTNEREKSTYWEKKFTALNEQYVKTDADYRMLQREVAAAEQAQEELHRDVQTRISSLVLERDTLRKDNYLLKTESRERTAEAAQLRTQIRGLKDFVNSNTRTDGQVTDEVFREMMERLGNGVQNWVITNFRKAKLDVSAVNDRMHTQLEALVPSFEQLVTVGRIHLIQSILSGILAERIFGAYFVGLPKDREAQLRDTEAYLQTLGSASSINQWRSTTLGIIRKEVSSLQDETEAIQSSIISELNEVLKTITDVPNSEPRDQALGSLVSSAIDLARLMRVQRAAFTAIMPTAGQGRTIVFDPERMEDIGGEDENSLLGQAVRCVTFPGIVKQGDENGEQSELTNVIAKARVICVLEDGV